MKCRRSSSESAWSYHSRCPCQSQSCSLIVGTSPRPDPAVDREHRLVERVRMQRVREASRLLVERGRARSMAGSRARRRARRQREGRYEQDQEIAVGREEDALDEDHPGETGKVAEDERRHAPTRPDTGLARRSHRRDPICAGTSPGCGATRPAYDWAGARAAVCGGRAARPGASRLPRAAGAACHGPGRRGGARARRDAGLRGRHGHGQEPRVPRSRRALRAPRIVSRRPRWRCSRSSCTTTCRWPPPRAASRSGPSCSRAARTTPAGAWWCSSACGSSTRRTATPSTRLRPWLDTTSTGDRAELDHEPPRGAWAEVAVGPERCLGARCTYLGDVLRRGGARAGRAMPTS